MRAYFATLLLGACGALSPYDALSLPGDEDSGQPPALAEVDGEDVDGAEGQANRGDDSGTPWTGHSADDSGWSTLFPPWSSGSGSGGSGGTGSGGTGSGGGWW